MFEAEFWVAISFVIFVAVMAYFGVHKLMVKGIDDRRDSPLSELPPSGEETPRYCRGLLSQPIFECRHRPQRLFSDGHDLAPADRHREVQQMLQNRVISASSQVPALEIRQK